MIERSKSDASVFQPKNLFPPELPQQRRSSFSLLPTSPEITRVRTERRSSIDQVMPNPFGVVAEEIKGIATIIQLRIPDLLAKTDKINIDVKNGEKGGLSSYWEEKSRTIFLVRGPVFAEESHIKKIEKYHREILLHVIGDVYNKKRKDLEEQCSKELENQCNTYLEQNGGSFLARHYSKEMVRIDYDKKIETNTWLKKWASEGIVGLEPILEEAFPSNFDFYYLKERLLLNDSEAPCLDPWIGGESLIKLKQFLSGVLERLENNGCNLETVHEIFTNIFKNIAAEDQPLCFEQICVILKSDEIAKQIPNNIPEIPYNELVTNVKPDLQILVWFVYCLCPELFIECAISLPFDMSLCAFDCQSSEENSFSENFIKLLLALVEYAKTKGEKKNKSFIELRKIFPQPWNELEKNVKQILMTSFEEHHENIQKVYEIMIPFLDLSLFEDIQLQFAYADAPINNHARDYGLEFTP